MAPALTARLASGRDVSPTVVAAEASSKQGAAAPAHLSMSAAHIQAVRRGMIAVVNEDGGTGSRAQGEDGGYLLAGKTGTSQVSSLSRDSAQGDLPWEKRDHALFVAYAPVSAPRYAVATIIEHGGGGGAVAAPATREIMDLVMARDPLAKPVASDVSGGARRFGDG